jgi:preprotein translocase subunit YajC
MESRNADQDNSRGRSGETRFRRVVLGSSTQLLLLPVFLVLMYFVMIVPNQRKQKKWQEMLNKLKNGDRVTTNGGIRGTIVSVKDDAVQLRIPPDNIKMEFVKSAIASVTAPDE